MRILLGVLMALFFHSVSFAASGGSGVLLSLGYLEYDQDTEGSQIGTGKSHNTYYDLKLGYLLGNNLYVGGMYSAYNHNDDSSNDPKRTLYGVTLGYHSNGWFLDGTLFFDGTRDQGNLELKKAEGLGIDIGYQYMLGSNFFIGAEGSYKSYTFKEYSQSGVTYTQSNKVKSEVYPMVVLGAIF